MIFKWAWPVLAGFLVFFPFAAAAQEYTTTSLFDGSTLNGWSFYRSNEPIDSSGIWIVRDETIEVRTSALSEGHWLVAEGIHTEFILTFEFRIASSNSGLNFHSFWGPEDVEGLQVDFDNGANIGRIYDVRIRNGQFTGQYQSNVDGNLLSSTYMENEFNAMEVRVEDGRVQVFLNDVQLTDYTPDENRVDSGFIAFQVHPDQQVEYDLRNIYLSKESTTIGVAIPRTIEINKPGLTKSFNLLGQTLPVSSRSKTPWIGTLEILSIEPAP